jgi:hypothetical protein
MHPMVRLSVDIGASNCLCKSNLKCSYIYSYIINLEHLHFLLLKLQNIIFILGFCILLRVLYQGYRKNSLSPDKIPKICPVLWWSKTRPLKKAQRLMLQYLSRSKSCRSTGKKLYDKFHDLYSLLKIFWVNE